MGGLFSGPPKPPTPPPPPPQVNNPQVLAAAAAARRRAVGASGVGSTNATGPQGLTTKATTAAKSLLG